MLIVDYCTISLSFKAVTETSCAKPNVVEDVLGIVLGAPKVLLGVEGLNFDER